jgi:hypothetical protein
MDNQNNIGSSFASTPPPPPPVSSSESGFFSGLTNISFTTWLIIILVLALLGFNIFAYLAKGTQTFADIFRPIIKTVTDIFAAVTGKAIEVTAGGTKTVLNKTTDVLDKGLTVVQDAGSNIVEQTAPSSLKLSDITIDKNNEIMNDISLNKSQYKDRDYNSEFMADDTRSNIQSGKQKAGWCFIGESKGLRTCAEVGVNDTCMSGDIFPTNEICINPKLRS